MLGAIIGDIIGSVYEWNNIKTTEFPLFGKGCRPTDDSIMSIAVADGLIRAFRKSEEAIRPDEETIKRSIISSMQHFGRKYPRAGYGGKFNAWLKSDDPQPYNSWGNGSAMRVSSVGWLAASLADAEELAQVTAEVTHNHEEGIRGAQAIAAAVYLARAKCSKEDIKAYIEKYHGYDLSVPLDEIRADYEFDVSCQGSVPWAIRAFLEAESYEEAVRLAISIGGDSDTIACMAGAIAEAYYGIPKEIKAKGLKVLDNYLTDKLNAYRDFYHEHCEAPGDLVQGQVRSMIKGPYAGGNPAIEEAVKKWREKTDDGERLVKVLDTIVEEMRKELEVITPIEFPEGLVIPENPTDQDQQQSTTLLFRTVETSDGENWMVAFTNEAEFKKGEKSSSIPILFADLARFALEEENFAGIVINPFGAFINIPKDFLQKMLELSKPIPQHELDLEAGAQAYRKGDYETAIRLYQKAADAGNVTALSNLGYCYYYGRNVPLDKEKARACWEKAAVFGDICAIYKLGDMYRNGDLPEDPVFSKKLYMQAFRLATENKDLWSYPDAYLRMLKYCRDQFSAEELKIIAKSCIEGFEERVRQEDEFAERLLKEAVEIQKVLDKEK